jgi:hypothetical protein
MAEQNGLPDVDGLADFLKSDADLSFQDKGQEPQQTQQTQTPDVQTQQPTTPPVEGQVEDADLQGILKSFTTPDGKVRTKDLLKSYKEIQGFTTRVSQENAATKAELQKLREELELRQMAQQAPPQYTDKSFEQLFIENPEQAIVMKATQIANTQRIAEVLESEEERSPEEYQERVAYVQMLAKHPTLAPLAATPKGVKKLFEKADEYRKNQMSRKAQESLKVLFGDNVDVEKLKSLLQKDTNGQTVQTTNSQTKSNAYMPDVTGSFRTGADAENTRNALGMARDDALKRGDAEAVAGAILREALLK